MGWKDTLQAASYRGAKFFVENAGYQGGRRVANHEFIARTLPYAEDMGARQKSFTITGYVLGADYLSLRDALETACNKGGPGTLIHPTRGSIEVNCGEIQVDERLTEEGGIARFTMPFYESGRLEYPSSTVDRVASVDKAAKGLSALAIADFAQKVVTTGVSEFVCNALRDEVGGLSTALLGVKFTGSDVQDVSAYVKLAQALVPGLAGVLDDPAALATKIVDIMQHIRTTAASGTGRIATDLTPFTNYVATGKNTGTTPSQVQGQANRTALVSLVRTVATAEKASAAQRDTYDSYDSAIATRDEILTSLDGLADTASDALYPALQDVRAEVVQSLPPPDQDLPRIAAVYLPVSQPAVVLAYSLYDDATRDGEIVDRNDIRHPGFLPANRKLQVLADA